VLESDTGRVLIPRRLLVTFAVLLLGIVLIDPMLHDILSNLLAKRAAERWLLLSIHAALITFSFAAVVMVLIARSRILKSIMLTLLCVSGCVVVSYKRVTGAMFGTIELKTLQGNLDLAASAISSFSSAALPSLLLFLTGLAIVGLVSFRSHYLPALHALGPLILAVAFNTAVFYRSVWKTNTFPAFFSFLNVAVYELSDDTYTGPRSQPALTAEAPLVRHIILVVDESIRSDYLSINGYPKPTTPFLEASSPKYLNYSPAMAGSGCSSYSHLILRSGLRQLDLPDTGYQGMRSPDLFRYAKKAGLRTLYLDGQIWSRRLTNMLTVHDEAYIDFFYQHTNLQLGEGDELKRNLALLEEYRGKYDLLLAIQLAEALKQSESSFAYVIKRGLHFHYEDSYPSQAPKTFAPTLETNEPYGDKNRTRNSYRNGLRWSVDGFFAELLPRIDELNYLLIYTSDHGQNLMDNGLLVTHCTPTEVNEPQVLVPLLVFASDLDLRARFVNVFERRRARSTHFELFPTLLIAMGYPQVQVQAEYGPSLFADDLNPSRFYTGDVFGRDRRGQWLEIRMDTRASN